MQVLEQLYRCNALVESAGSAREEENLNKLKNVITYMQQHYTQPLPAGTGRPDLPEPYLFLPLFPQETGKSPIGFLNEYRIQQAAQLLTESDLSVSQIAVAVGFDNFSYFIRKFREYKRVSPKEYRKQLCGSR